MPKFRNQVFCGSRPSSSKLPEVLTISTPNLHEECQDARRSSSNRLGTRFWLVHCKITCEFRTPQLTERVTTW